MNNRKRQITIYANVEEQAMFERIKRFHQRNTDSDMLRLLIKQENKKILSGRVSIETNSPRAEACQNEN